MKHKENSVNRKALPKFLGIVLLSALFGGIVGLGIGFMGSTNLPDQIVASIYSFLGAITPWSIGVLGLLFLGVAVGQYRSAKKLFLDWDGEDEDTIERAEEKLSWGLLASSLNLVSTFFFFGIGFQTVGIQTGTLELIFFLSFILSLAGTVLFQQKVVDLTRQINPEKQGSVYDSKFQKKWLDSCDENEQRQIGQAAYKAFNAVNTTCVLLWAILVLLGYSFGIGVLPFFLVMLIFGINQAVYILTSIRLERHRK